MRPDDGHGHDPGLTGARGHLEGVTAEFFGRELLCVFLRRNFHQPGKGLDCFALAEIISEGHTEAGNLVVLLEPVPEKVASDLRGAFVTFITPSVNRGAN